MNTDKALHKAQEAQADTVFGLAVESTSSTSDDLIVRTALQELSRSVWYELFKNGRDEEDIRDGAEIVEGQFRDSRQFNLEVVPPGGDPLGWYTETDPDYWFEYLEDDWLTEDVWEGVRWTWPEISLLACLVMIDLSVQALEGKEVHKAAVWLFRSSESFGRRRLSGAPAVDATDIEALSRLGRRGAHARHEANRAAKERARQLFRERSWRSLAEAARAIAPKVHRVEAVVQRWLREFRHDPAGKVHMPPEE